MGRRVSGYCGFLSIDEARRELETLRPLRTAVIQMLINRFHSNTPGHAELYAIVEAIDHAAERFCGDRHFFIPPAPSYPGEADTSPHR